MPAHTDTDTATIANPFEKTLSETIPTVNRGSARAASGLPWATEIMGDSESKLYSKLELSDLGWVGDFEPSGKMLEFPDPLGTDELNHFVTFTVFHGLESIMTAEELTKWSETVTDQTITGAATALIAGGSAMYVTPKILNRIAASSTRLKGLPKIGPVAAVLAGLAAAYYGWHLGSGEMTLTEAEKDQVNKFSKIVEALKEAAENEAALEFGDPLESGRVTRFGKAHFRHADTISLYMPQKIQALSLLEYEQQDMSFVQNVINDWTGLAAKSALVRGPGFADQITSFLGVNSNLGAAIQGAFRMAPNPRKQLMFREPVSRKFEFNFHLSPRNEIESARAWEIIQTFKKHAYPKLSQAMGKGAFYNFPAEFEIHYYTMQGPNKDEPMENDFLNKIGRCALREINVDYASSGSFSTFKNGAPTNMILSLTFEEMELLDSSMIEAGY